MPYKDRAYDAYTTQIRGARRRGIEWVFIFEDWLDWWVEQLGPNWFKLRGCKRGQYVMARIKDAGPYARWNVKCVLTEVNCHETVHVGQPGRMGSENANSKLTELKIVEIFYAKGPYRELGRKYGVRSDYIERIKSRRAWKHITLYL